MNKELIDAVVKAIGNDCPHNRHLAVRAIEAHTAHLEANGLVIVPREPTEVMAGCGMGEFDCSNGLSSREVMDAYRAMIQAAQKEPG